MTNVLPQMSVGTQTSNTQTSNTQMQIDQMPSTQKAGRQSGDTHPSDATGVADQGVGWTVARQRVTSDVVDSGADDPSTVDKRAPEPSGAGETDGATDRATDHRATDRATGRTEPTGRGEPRAPAAKLSDRQRRMLVFERQWWRHPGSKEQAIREQFDLSATGYYQMLNQLLEHPEAAAFDPLVVGRLRRLRSTRARKRSAR